MAEDPQSIHKKQIKNIDPEHTRLPTSTWPILWKFVIRKFKHRVLFHHVIKCRFIGDLTKKC